MWRFDSNGGVLRRTGTWNEKSSTLTMRGEAGDAVVTTESHFPDDDTELWAIRAESREGKVLQTFKGKNVRKR